MSETVEDYVVLKNTISVSRIFKRQEMCKYVYTKMETCSTAQPV